MTNDYIDPFDFTGNAWELFFDSVDDAAFQDDCIEIIYDTLQRHELLIPFGEYLKRYIYKTAELTLPADSLGLEDYQQIIMGSFRDHSTPASFQPGAKTKLSAFALNCLRQRTVKREAVFLLGFGLGMSAEEVNEFLTKALGEREIHPKIPSEVICWFCYKKGYGFPTYRELMKKYEKLPLRYTPGTSISDDMTYSWGRSMYAIRDEKMLMKYLATLKANNGESRLSVSARESFDSLYRQVQALIAGQFNEEEKLRVEREAAEYRRSHVNELYYERERKIEETVRAAQKHYLPDDITASDVENVFCAEIPKETKVVRDKELLTGNLVPEHLSVLQEQFGGKRFSRQHITRVLNRKGEISRFDLITLNFYLFSQKAYAHRASRLSDFTESTNRILNRCRLGELHVQNAYEAFLGMCLLSEEPFETYLEVIGLSYSQDLASGDQI